MPKTQAKIGYETFIEKYVAATIAPDPVVAAHWLRVMEVRNVGGPTLARDAPEATNMDSPDGWKEFIKGLKDGGEVSFEVNYLPATENTTTRLGHNADDGLLGDFDNDETTDLWRVLISKFDIAMNFFGILTGFEPDAQVDDVLTGAATFKISGKPELDADPTAEPSILAD